MTFFADRISRGAVVVGRTPRDLRDRAAAIDDTPMTIFHRLVGRRLAAFAEDDRAYDVAISEGWPDRRIERKNAA